MKKICLLFAMSDEAQKTIDLLEPNLIEDGFFKVYKKNNLYIVISGIGIVNASSCFTYINNKYNFDLYINLGLVGTNDTNLNILDIILVDKVYLGNVDVSGFGYKLGQVPKMPEFYEVDQELLKEYENKLSINKIANICSSDCFINSQEKYESIIGKINKNITIFDMECAGIYQVAHIFKKPIISIKVISDILNVKSSELQFSQILEQASIYISQIALKLVN